MADVTNFIAANIDRIEARQDFVQFPRHITLVPPFVTQDMSHLGDIEELCEQESRFLEPMSIFTEEHTVLNGLNVMKVTGIPLRVRNLFIGIVGVENINPVDGDIEEWIPHISDFEGMNTGERYNVQSIALYQKAVLAGGERFRVARSVYPIQSGSICLRRGI